MTEFLAAHWLDMLTTALGLAYILLEYRASIWLWAVGFAMQTLLDAGAPEVWTTPVGMKKNRPGILLTCLCRANQRDEMVRLLFRHTSTIGVRESVCRRWVLRRESGEVTTPYGPVRVKRSEGYGVTKTKAEYDDLAAIARAHGLTLDEVRRLTVETE